MMGLKFRLLILGGTGEAAALAEALARDPAGRVAVTTSLAGRTEHPAALAGDVRIGGFGGAQGLMRYLTEQRIDGVIDATHPFAAEMSRHAHAACAALGLPLLRLDRPAWKHHPLDRWAEVADMAQAAQAAASLGRRAWLTIGRGEMAPFAALPGMWFLVRLIDRPRTPLPLPDYHLILGRGPFPLAGERLLLAHYRIDVLVTKASGGDATEAKLVAAREASLPVVMIRRPPPSPGDRVESVEAALAWLAGRARP